MASKSALLLLVLAVCCSAQTCPKFVCSASLGRNVCANRLPDKTFQLNNRGCERDFYCTATGTYTWATLSTSTWTYHCPPVLSLSSTSESVAWTSVACSTKGIDRDFRSGQTVVLCDSNADCILRDGSLSSCTCGFRSDGRGVCAPDISNLSLFSKYWEECGSSNTITNQNAYLYWSQYITLYSILQSGLDCISIFKEVQDLKALDYNASAGVLAVAAWIALG